MSFASSSHLTPPIHAPPVQLSPRERDVLILFMRGLTTKLVAQELGIARWTVKQYSKMLYRKLGVNNRTAAVMWGAQLDALRRDATSNALAPTQVTVPTATSID